MQNYRRRLVEHLLPEFENVPLGNIVGPSVDAWEKKERALYAASSVRSWRSLLHLILADAVDEGLIPANPALKRRGRSKRAGRSLDRGPEKAVTSPLGALLIAERAALLSGRDDEFVVCLLLAYTGLRWAEIVGLETEFVRPASIRVEWQLYELDTGELVRCPPKDDSYRTVDLPLWLSDLVFDHLTRTRPTPCLCRGKTYVFRGRGAARAGRTGTKLVDVARRAEVSAGDGIERAKPARAGRRGHPSAGRSRHRGPRLHPGRRGDEVRSPLAPKRLRDVAVHPRGVRLVPEEGAPAGPPGTGARPPLARRTGPGS
jgi:integrase